mgnify:CR=1 FL=1
MHRRGADDHCLRYSIPFCNKDYSFATLLDRGGPAAIMRQRNLLSPGKELRLMEKMRPTKEKAPSAGCGMPGAGRVVVIAFFVLRPAPKNALSLPARPGHRSDPSAQWDIRDVTDPAQIEEIVALLNGFTYRTSRDVAPATGWEYHAVLSTDTWLTISPSPQAPCAFGTMTAVPPFIPAHPGISSPWLTWRTASPLSFLEKA